MAASSKSYLESETTPFGNPLCQRLLEQLRTAPWLIVMDGMERLLVRYNRLDAANQPDNFKLETIPQGLSNDCHTIRPQDGDILRAFAGAKPTKILASSRLMPSCLINAAGQPMPGVQVIQLKGLEQADAVAFFHQCGVTGTDTQTAAFLEANCGNHPMVIGALAGLVVNDIQSAGNFAVWLKLNQRMLKAVFKEMNLIGRKNHILDAAMASLSPMSRRLLSVLASISGGVGIEALKAFNPHAFDTDLYGMDVSPTDIDQVEAMKQLSGTVNDLRSRGLLQVSADRKIYDLHPVIRGCVYAIMNAEDKAYANNRVIDHFTSASSRPFFEVTTMESLRPGIEIFHAILRNGALDLAFLYFHKNLCDAMLFNLEEHHRCLGMLFSFFKGSSANCDSLLSPSNECTLLNISGICSLEIADNNDANTYFSRAIQNTITAKKIGDLIVFVLNYAVLLWRVGKLKLAIYYIENLLRLRDPWATDLDRFSLLSFGHDFLTVSGHFEAANIYWKELDPMGRNWPVSRYRQGEAEAARINWHYHNGTLTEEHFAVAERLAHGHSASRPVRRRLSRIRGFFELRKGDLQSSRDHYADAVQSAREMDLHDGIAEAKYLQLNHLIGEGPETLEIQRRIQSLLLHPDCSKIDVAELCRAIGDDELAHKLSREVIEEIDSQGEFFELHENRVRALEIAKDVQGVKA